MKPLSTASSVVLLVASCSWAQAEELKRASLAGLSRVGAVIVTAAADTVAESDVRRAVERRLAKARIAVDGEPGPELLVSVSAERGRAERGTCECATFRVQLSLREPVLLERPSDGAPVAATTWTTSGSVRVFSLRSPRLTIMDLIEDGLGAFLRAVASDTQQAAHDQGTR